MFHTLDKGFFFCYGAFYVDSLSDRTLVLWLVEANTLDKTTVLPQDQKRTRAVVLCLTATARFFKYRISAGRMKLLSPLFKVFGKVRLPVTAAERRMLCFQII